MNETLDQIHDSLETEHPGFKAEVSRIMAANAQKEADDAQTAQQWRDRKRVKFTDLSFVGKNYRSRNRRSANKVTAWAVKTPDTNKAAAAQGAAMAVEFCQWTVDSPIAGAGRGLFEVIEGMADRLAKAKPRDRWTEETRITAFCSVLELHTQLFAGYQSFTDLTRAQQQANSLSMLESWQGTQQANVFASAPGLFGGDV
jgi:hypothetical protein